jgi:hypothetical protein
VEETPESVTHDPYLLLGMERMTGERLQPPLDRT